MNCPSGGQNWSFGPTLGYKSHVLNCQALLPPMVVDHKWAEEIHSIPPKFSHTIAHPTQLECPPAHKTSHGRRKAQGRPIPTQGDSAKHTLEQMAEEKM